MLNINNTYTIILETEEDLQVWNKLVEEYNVEWKLFATNFSEKRLIISCPEFVFNMMKEDAYAVH